MRNTDFSQMAVGRYPIDGEQMFALVQSPMTQAWETGKAEFHSRYIDIQYLLEGEELIGYAITKLLESNVTQLNIRSPDAEKMK
jgi:biofilm protein TabA